MSKGLWALSLCVLLSGALFINAICPDLSSLQSFTCVGLFATPWTAARQASLSITNSWSQLMSIKSVMSSNYLTLCHPLFLPLSIFPSIRVFSNESVLPISWPKYWSFCFSISPSNEYSGLISFRRDWLDRLAVQGTLKSLLQHHSSKASILQCSAFFIGQLSYPYMTTGKTTAVTRWTFGGKVMSLLFNMLSRLVIAFLPKSKHLLISLWFWSPRKESLSLFPLFPHLLALKWRDQMPLSSFSECWVLSQLFPLSSFTFIKRLFSSSSLSAIRMVSSMYPRLLIFHPAILIPPCALSSLAFCTMYSAYKLNKQGDNIQLWCNPVPIWNQSVVPCPLLTVASWPAYSYLRRQVR